MRLFRLPKQRDVPPEIESQTFPETDRASEKIGSPVFACRRIPCAARGRNCYCALYLRTICKRRG